MTVLFSLTIQANGVVRSLKEGTNIEGRVYAHMVLEMWLPFNKNCFKKDGEPRQKISELAAKSDTGLSCELIERLGEGARHAFWFYDTLCDVLEQCPVYDL